MIAIALACNPRVLNRGRADHGPRRHHPGADPGSREAAPARVGHGDRLDYPRPGGHGRPRRPGDGDVRRTGGRARERRGGSTGTRGIPTRAACSPRCRGSAARGRNASKASPGSPRTSTAHLPPARSLRAAATRSSVAGARIHHWRRSRTGTRSPAGWSMRRHRRARRRSRIRSRATTPGWPISRAEPRMRADPPVRRSCWTGVSGVAAGAGRDDVRSSPLCPGRWTDA